MITNFRIDTNLGQIKYERGSIANVNGRVVSFWVKYVQGNGGMIRGGQAFVPGTRPARADVVNAFDE